MITGSYVNNAAGFQCQGTSYPLVGWYLNTATTFSVIWSNSAANCNSVTAWTGNYVGGNFVMDWSLSQTGGPILMGKDTFSLVSGSENILKKN